MMTPPPSHLLDQLRLSPGGSSPIHQQIRSFLQQAIEDHFEDGQSFWTEMLLMERLGVARGTVREALKELTAQGLLVREASRRTYVHKTEVTSIGVVFSRYESDFLVELVHQVAAFCLERKLHLELYPTTSHRSLDEIVSSIRRPPQKERIILLGGNFDGLGCADGDDLHQKLSAQGYRVVLVGDATATPNALAVDTDPEQAIQLAVEHLLELGHRRLTFMVNEPTSRKVVARKMAEFERLVKLHQFEGHLATETDKDVQNAFDVGYRMMPRIWNEDSQPTAILTASDPGAWAALRWLHEHDVKVPSHVSVVGFEGVKPDAFTHPPLTTVAHSMDELVRRAFHLLWLGQTELVREWVAPHLVVRQSTGPYIDRE